MTTNTAIRPTHQAATKLPGVRPSQVLHHANMATLQMIEPGAAADRLLRDLRPPRHVISDAYVTHVRRIHRKRATGTEASHTLRILETALQRRPPDTDS
jgi:hypothetical protein